MQQTRKRTCVCGTRLASDNPGPKCSPCHRARALSRVTGDPGPYASRLGRTLAELYSRYADCDSREIYLAELTPLLDGLCELFGFRLPTFEGTTKPLRMRRTS